MENNLKTLQQAKQEEIAMESLKFQTDNVIRINSNLARREKEVAALKTELKEVQR